MWAFITPLYAIAYAIMNSTENLRFDKDGLLTLFLVFPYIIETHSWKFGRTRNSLKTLSTKKHYTFPLQFLVLPNFQHSCIYNCIENM